MKRGHITKTAKLAAALRELARIPYEHAKLMTAEQVESLFQFHHIHYHADSQNDEHWNLEPMLIKAHRERTAKIDVPQIAKTKRISKAQEEFRARMLVPPPDRPAKQGRQSRWGSRPFPKRSKR